MRHKGQGTAKTEIRRTELKLQMNEEVSTPHCQSCREAAWKSHVTYEAESLKRWDLRD